MPNIEKSKSYNIAKWSFIVCSGFVFLGILNDITIGTAHFQFKMISSEVVLYFMAPSLALYGMRRFTDAKFGSNGNGNGNGENGADHNAEPKKKT